MVKIHIYNPAKQYLHLWKLWFRVEKRAPKKMPFIVLCLPPPFTSHLHSPFLFQSPLPQPHIKVASVIPIGRPPPQRMHRQSISKMRVVTWSRTINVMIDVQVYFITPSTLNSISYTQVGIQKIVRRAYCFQQAFSAQHQSIASQVGVSRMIRNGLCDLVIGDGSLSKPLRSRGNT